MHYSSAWLILRNQKFNTVTSSTGNHRPRGQQSIPKLRKLFLQWGLLPLIRVGAHDRLKLLDPLLDCCFIYMDSCRSSKLKSGQCSPCMTVIYIEIVRIKASWIDEIRWALANTMDSPPIPLQFFGGPVLTVLRGGTTKCLFFQAREEHWCSTCQRGIGLRFDSVVLGILRGWGVLRTLSLTQSGFATKWNL